MAHDVRGKELKVGDLVATGEIGTGSNHGGKIILGKISQIDGSTVSITNLETFRTLTRRADHEVVFLGSD